MTKSAKIGAALAVLAIAGVGGGWFWLNDQVKPTAPGPDFFVRLKAGSNLQDTFQLLEEKGVLKNAGSALLFVKLRGQQQKVTQGTYQFHPGMSVDEILKSLQKSVRRMVLVKEGRWIKRTAVALEKLNVCKADEYIELANNPEKFKDAVSFPLPADSLEGYLYPDTYDLPPLIGAEAAIKMQLRNFESKIYKKLPEGVDLHRALTMGSIIQTEVALDSERPIVAGLIENRIKKGMRLEMDATVLYALQEWKVLGPGVVKTVKSPYNTYLNKGLPPGPICSPTDKSVFAAIKPAKTDYLYYVAGATKAQFFSKSYPEHIQNIKKARAEVRAAKAAAK